jgi:hypothetical protein
MEPVGAGAATTHPTQPSTAGRPMYVRAALEIAIIATFYFAYRFGRLIGIGREDVAHAHAELVHRVQEILHLPSEAAIQDAVASIPHVYEIANHYYVTLHFPVIIAFLLWGFFARPRGEYVWARNLLIVQTSLALLIHIVFPLAPPRMYPQWGFVDTMAVFGPNAYEGASASVANQYAAMPSLHIGWAVLIAVVITANHWLLDGLVASALLALAMVLFPGPSRYRFSLRGGAR